MGKSDHKIVSMADKAEPLNAWDVPDRPGVVAFQAAPIVSKDDPPSEFRMLQRGVTRMRKGGKIFNILLDDEGEQSIKDAMASKGREQLPIDYDHGMLGLIASRDSSAAAGWFTLEFRGDGMWATAIEWTTAAFESIKNREFRFTSPALMLDETEELGVLRATEIINVAVTNLPATVGQKPLVAHETTTKTQEAAMPFPKELLKQLGLKEDATEEQVAAAIKALNETAAAAKEATELAAKAEAERAEAVELASQAAKKAEDEKKAAADAKQEQQQLLSDTGSADLTALRERIGKLEKTEETATGLSTRIVLLEKQKADDEHAAAFAQLDADGKLPESLHEWAKTQSTEQLVAFGAGAPVVHAARTQSAVTKKAGTTMLSDEDRKVMKLMALGSGDAAETKFLAARQNENNPVLSCDMALMSWAATPIENSKKAGPMITLYLNGHGAN